MVGAAQVEVLPDGLLEQHAPLDGPVEDLGEGELRQWHGDVAADAGLAVGARERVRQALELLVAVDAQLGVEREARAELDEERPEVLIHRAHVVVVHART